MANIIDWIKDRKKNIIVPKTMTKAVYDDNGVALCDTLANLLVSDIGVQSTISINALAELSGTIAITEKEGYTPIGIAGWYLGSTNSKYCRMNKCIVLDNSIAYTIKNDGSETAEPLLTVYVLYKLNA